MTEVRVMTHAGFTLVYDTADVEDMKVSADHHFVEGDGPNGSVHRTLTGYASLDVHIDFKHGRRALWVKDDEGPAS